ARPMLGSVSVISISASYAYISTVAPGSCKTYALAPSYAPGKTCSVSLQARDTQAGTRGEREIERLTRQCGMQVDDAYPLRRQGNQKPLPKDLHPTSQHDKMRLVLKNLGRQRGVVVPPCLVDPLGVLLALLLEAVGYQVEVLPGDALA